MRRRTAIVGVTLCLLLAGGGVLVYQLYKEHQAEQALILNCTTCDTRKANQMRSRESLLEQDAEDTRDDQ
ncbi:MAG: hypothetical protein RIM72_15660 [Alphaproteobacteria bacterium]